MSKYHKALGPHEASYILRAQLAGSLPIDRSFAGLAERRRAEAAAAADPEFAASPLGPIQMPDLTIKHGL
jgi:hypothetical protein